MSDLQYRLITKNEATGVRVVSQYVREYWECGWQELDARNDRGLDGIIFMRKRNVDLGVRINIQVKCGSKYISSENKDEIRISIDNSRGFLDHLNYWKNQLEPTVLVFVNPGKKKRDLNGTVDKDEYGKSVWVESRKKAQAWWVDLKDEGLHPENTSTIIRLKRKNVFGEHSKGDFLKLIRSHLSIYHLPAITINEESKKLLNSSNLAREAKDFFKQWKNNNLTFCKALNQNIRVSKTGWNHITAKRRGQERRKHSLSLLGVARQIIQESEQIYLLNQSERFDELEQKYGIRGRYFDKYLGRWLEVQVIVLRRLNLKSRKEKLWFYSVHHRR